MTVITARHVRRHKLVVIMRNKSPLFLLGVFLLSTPAAYAAATTPSKPIVTITVKCCSPLSVDIKFGGNAKVAPEPRKGPPPAFVSDAQAFVENGQLVMIFPPGVSLPPGGLLVDATAQISPAAMAQLGVRSDQKLAPGMYRPGIAPASSAARTAGGKVVSIPFAGVLAVPRAGIKD